MAESLALSYAEAPGRPLPDVIVQPGLSYDEVLHDDFRFDLNAHDVMVFLHIQKTGGTSFGKHLVMDLDLKVCAFASQDGGPSYHFVLLIRPYS